MDPPKGGYPPNVIPFELSRHRISTRKSRAATVESILEKRELSPLEKEWHDSLRTRIFYAKQLVEHNLMVEKNINLKEIRELNKLDDDFSVVLAYQSIIRFLSLRDASAISSKYELPLDLSKKIADLTSSTDLRRIGHLISLASQITELLTKADPNKLNYELLYTRLLLKNLHDPVYTELDFIMKSHELNGIHLASSDPSTHLLCVGPSSLSNDLFARTEVIEAYRKLRKSSPTFAISGMNTIALNYSYVQSAYKKADEKYDFNKAMRESFERLISENNSASAQLSDKGSPSEVFRLLAIAAVLKVFFMDFELAADGGMRFSQSFDSDFAWLSKNERVLLKSEISSLIGKLRQNPLSTG